MILENFMPERRISIIVLTIDILGDREQQLSYATYRPNLKDRLHFQQCRLHEY